MLDWRVSLSLPRQEDEWMKAVLLFTVLLGFLQVVQRADDKPDTAMSQTLKMPTSFHVKSEPFASALARLSKHVQANLPQASSPDFEIKILAGDLKLDGFTQNQTVRDIKLSEQPLRKVLTVLLQSANGDPTLKDPTVPQQRMVWVIGPDPEDADRQIILITTRRMAQQRSYQLPDEFLPKQQTPPK